jgi:hypothetical protein
LGLEYEVFFFRLRRAFRKIRRLSKQDGRYQALAHPRVMDLDVTPVFNRGSKHLKDTRLGTFDTSTDGINNVKYTLLALRSVRPGYRHALIQLTFDDMPRDLSFNSTHIE